jgi:hypothetical protein
VALISFNELPLWTGLREKPSQYRIKPFAIDYCSDGFIKQCNTDLETVESYSDEGYSFITEPPGRMEWANTLARYYIEFLERDSKVWQNSRVLEVGGGSTYLGEHFVKKHGVKSWRIVDPACRESSGSDKVAVERLYFENYKGTEQCDIFLSINCLEHVSNPVSFLENVRANLADNGIAILIFPDTESQFEIGDLNSIMHEHISYFDRLSAQNLFNRMGFSISVSSLKNNTQYYLLKKKADVPQIPSHSLSVEKTKNQFENTLAFMRSVRQEIEVGRRVAFYGATNGLNNLLYLSGLYETEEYAVIDSDRSKQGKYLPCSKVPVIFSEAADLNNYDIIFISALTFYKDIFTYLTNTRAVEPQKVKPLALEKFYEF